MCFTDGTIVVTCDGESGFYDGNFNMSHSFGGVGCREDVILLNPNDQTNPEFSVQLEYIAPRLARPTFTGVMDGNRACGTVNIRSDDGGLRSNNTNASQRYQWQVSNSVNGSFVTFRTTSTLTTSISLSDVTSRGFSDNQELQIRVRTNDLCSSSRVSEPRALTFLPPGSSFSLSSSMPTCPEDPVEITLNASNSDEHVYSIRNIGANQTGDGRNPFTSTTTISSSTVTNGLNIGIGRYSMSLRRNFADGTTGCPSSRTITIDVPDPGISDLEAFATNCEGGDNGRIEVEIDNIRSGDLTYYISQNGTVLPDFNNQNTGLDANTTLPDRFTVTGLSAGDYRIEIEDGCNADRFPGNLPNEPPRLFTVTDGPAITVTGNPIPPRCLQGTGDGQIEVTVTGGTESFDYELSGASSDSEEDVGSTHTFMGLSPGTYTVSATTAEGCIGSETDIVITAPPGDFNIALDNPVLQVCPG
ncbi:MAG: hypothetical protein AAFP00_10750, partial [Bacteroidota bacterium]